MLLRRSGGGGSQEYQVRAAVYLRALGPDQGKNDGSMYLQRVAAIGTPGNGGLQGQGDVIVLQLGPQQGDGSAFVHPWPLAETCLVNEEVLMLPNSGALVLPLVDSHVLVGLLVVEPSTTAASAVPALPQQGDATPPEPDTAAAHTQPGGLTVSHLRRPSGDALEGAAVQQPPLSDGHYITPDPGGIPSWLPPVYPGFSDEEVLALRATAPLLAKACAMELRASLAGAASATQAAIASALLREAQRPAAALNTFSAMLLPRMEENTPDKDLVQGIALQGKRLQELLRQLDSAILPSSRPDSVAAGGVNPAAPSLMNATGGVGYLPSQPASPAAGRVGSWHGTGQAGSGWPSSCSAAAPGGKLQGGGQSGAHTPGYGSAAAPSQAVISVDCADAGPGGFADTGTPQRLQPLASSTPAVATVSAKGTGCNGGSVVEQAVSQSLDEPLGGAVVGLSAAPGTQGPAGSNTAGQTGTPGSECRTFTMRLCPNDTAVWGSGPAVIDLEPDGSPSEDASNLARNRGSSPAARGSGTGPALSASALSPGAREPGTPGEGYSTDLVAALGNVLGAAAKLARATGVFMLLEHPLSAPLPPSMAGLVQTSTAQIIVPVGFDDAGLVRSTRKRGGARPGSGATAQYAGDAWATDASVPALRPRPARPLRVRAPPSPVQRIVAYMLDLAMQCTPRGGMVGVSARAAPGSWVECVLTHTGQLVLTRKHPNSPVVLSAPSLIPPRSPPTAQLSPRLSSGRGGDGGAPAAPVAQSARASTGMAVATVTRPALLTPQPHPATAGVKQPGSGLLSFALVEELVQSLGGSVSCLYPVVGEHVVTGQAESQTHLIIRLPAAA